MKRRWIIWGMRRLVQRFRRTELAANGAFRPIGSVPALASGPIVSTLDDSVLRFVGDRIWFQTAYGHGWLGTASWDDVPPAFSARLIRFFQWRNNRRGGIARVEAPNHILHGMWVIFATRHTGEFNFETQIPHCNVALFNSEPHDPVDGGSFWVITESIPGMVMAGFAEVSHKPDRPDEG